MCHVYHLVRRLIYVLLMQLCNKQRLSSVWLTQLSMHEMYLSIVCIMFLPMGQQCIIEPSIFSLHHNSLSHTLHVTPTTSQAS
jgi:hypothetical protein